MRHTDKSWGENKHCFLLGSPICDLAHLIQYLNLIFILNNVLDLNISFFLLFQVLEGLKKATLITPADVSFAEARRDALIAIAKYVCCLYLRLILSLEPFCSHSAFCCEPVA